MTNPKILLENILKLKKDLEFQGMKLPPGLAGMYGEILAFKKLQEIFRENRFSVKFFSGQKGADIQLLNGDEKINIEIKTSRLKEEGFGKYYAAALNIKKCPGKRHNSFYQHPTRGKIIGDFCYFDYVIFVALSENFLKTKFYIIPRSFIEKNEIALRNTNRRFSSATHRIIISDGKQMPNLSSEQKKLIKTTEFFIDKWNKIAN